MKSTQNRLFVVSILVIALLFGTAFFSPQKTKAASWEQVSTNGLGDVTNIDAVRLISFNGNLYTSLGNLAGVRIYRSADGQIWNKVNTDGFGDANNIDAVMVVYNSALFVGTVNIGKGGQGQLWKTTNGTDWTQIGPNGFGDPNNYGIVGIGEFNSKLYISMSNTVTGGEVFRLDNTSDLTQVNIDGFNDNSTQIRALEEYNGALYAATSNFNGGEIWKTTNGTTWSAVMQGGFGDGGNNMISTLFTFGGALYAGTNNGITGAEVWRATTGDTNWVQVNTDGFGDPNTDFAGDQVAVVNGTIYMGTSANLNSDKGARLFTSTNGTTWTQEGTDGFGDPIHNYGIYAINFNGRIYLGVSSETGAEIWRSGTMDTLAISTTSLGDEVVGRSYSAQLSTSAGTSPVVFSLTSGSLPDGQTLNSTGTISGTPTKSGTYTFTVAVTDSGTPQQIASRQLSIKVIDGLSVLPDTGIGEIINLKSICNRDKIKMYYY